MTYREGQSPPERYAGPAPGRAGGAIRPRCYETHPPLPIRLDQGRQVHIHGGSCLHPQIGDAAIYIGFDNGMKLTPPAYPWHGQRREVLFRIPDQGVPPDLAEFGRLLDWTADQLRQGGLIHAGCIGGHGRTGMFLAALVRQMTGNADAAQYVRDHYCCKAIESERQVAFLAQHFNIRPVIPHRPRRKRAEAAPGA